MTAVSVAIEQFSNEATMELQLQAIVLSTSGCFRCTFNPGGGKAGVAATFGQLQLQLVAAAASEKDATALTAVTVAVKQL